MSGTVLYLISSILVSTGVSLYIWKSSKTKGSRAFVAACSFSNVWIFGEIIGRISTTFEGQWAGEVIRYLGIQFLPFSLLIFIYQFCGKSIGKKTKYLLLIIPVITSIVIITNPYHHWFFSALQMAVDRPMKTTFGPYFWFVHLPHSYGLFLTGFITALVELPKATRHYKAQIRLLLVSLSVPFVINFIGVFRVFGDINYTSLSFPLFFLLMAFSISRYKFLIDNPIAYESVFNTIRDGVLIVDENDIIRNINPAAAKGLAKGSSEVVGMHVREAFGAWENAIELYDRKPIELGEIEVDLFGATRFLSIDSTPMLNRKGVSDGRIITIRDITDRYQHQLSLEAMAFHDPLTRVANRRKFQEEVDRAIAGADERAENFSILYIDLNRFKQVNDRFGHDVGDELLKYVAARIASIMRKPDILARLGGDEFSLLLHRADSTGVKVVVERILENVRRPFSFGEHTLVADLSIGSAQYPEDGTSLAELLRHADRAMYRAKQNGGGFDPQSIKIDSIATATM